MVPATRLIPKVMGTRTNANPAAKMNVSGSSRQRRFLTATARQDGVSKTMQQGANSATPPAKKAASTEPVVSRLLTGLSLLLLRQSPFELASGKAARAEVLPVQQDQGAHRRQVVLHQRATRLLADRHHVDGHRIRLREDCQDRLRVLTQVARGCLHQGDHHRYGYPLGRGGAISRTPARHPPRGGHLNFSHAFTIRLSNEGFGGFSMKVC